MKTSKELLNIAKDLKPALITTKCTPPDFQPCTLKAGEQCCFDFGNHFVGHVSLKLGFEGSHPDAPAWIRLKFAERFSELSENADTYQGWISKGWIQQEQLHIDLLPCTLTLPRRYAFRYVQIEVLDVSSKYALTVDAIECDATSSADDSVLAPYQSNDPVLKQIDRIACRTLHECMQDVFEDGPKRDRRLWMGDLHLQAKANYETFRNNDLVKRCLYLFAGCPMESGQIGAAVFTEPEVEVDDVKMFDYALIFIPTLLDYWKESGDAEALKALWPTAKKQIEIAEDRFDSRDIIVDSDVLGWCFVDWNLELNKQAAAQGIYLYCLSAAMELAEIANDMDAHKKLRCLYERRCAAAKQHLFNETLGVFVSGENRQISWASQIWMVLGGVLKGEEAAALLKKVTGYENAVIPVTPYLYHHYMEALISCGEKKLALEVLKAYWGGMAAEGADTFWELYNPQNPNESPYGGTIVNSYCHAWSCAPAYFLRKYYSGT